MTVFNPGGGGGAATFTQGTLAARPAATTPGATYYATDANQLYVTNAAGNAWQAMAGITQGTAAARPATPSAPQQLYFATDTGEWFIGNAAGNAWQSLIHTSNSVFSVGAGGFFQFTGSNTQYGATGVTNSSFDVTSVGSGLQVKEGSNAKQGLTAAMVGGTVTVANTSTTANSRIFLTSQATGGTVGGENVSGRTAGTSFTITSTSATDTSQVAFQIFEPG